MELLRVRFEEQVRAEKRRSAGTAIENQTPTTLKLDPAKNVQFRSYAQFRIRGAILDSLRTLDWSPRELRRKGRAVEETVRKLTPGGKSSAHTGMSPVA